ncbi:putative Protein PBDC1 like protein [Blattamonas nauphoetae]|uniref:Polysaccharide biosynthesis domain-containing protein n=1 Tax=Blattamonas nauphoetae TaxID=2049346 RepID=A0ABQ9YL29_9EUKA|nr:putative Protein PBDC1 like protein [Blattamonas nauphoetae]
MSIVRNYVVNADKPTPAEQAMMDQQEIANDHRIEQQWAIKAVKYAEVYMNLLKAMDPAKLRLSPIDDKIYKRFREAFPDLNVEIINENELTSKEGKEKWRPFLMEFEKSFDDWDMGTLLRINSHKDADQENTMIVTRIQFICIELARNREGHNKDFQKPK